MSTMAKACQEEGAHHALEATSATKAVQVIQVNNVRCQAGAQACSLPHLECKLHARLQEPAGVDGGLTRLSRLHHYPYEA